MRVTVLGAAGLLGRHLVEELSGHDVRALDRRSCDVSRLDDVVHAAEGAELIVNCAGLTNVDAAETRSEEAYQANAVGAENVARAALRVGARALHVSTDFVFHGARSEPFDELDEPNPQSTYARSKRAGETLFQAVGGRLFLVRVQALYGAGGRGFSSKLRDLIAAGTPLTIDCERRVQPTWVRTAARQIIALATTEHYGTYHVSCQGETTWAGFARFVAERLGVVPAWREVATADLHAPAPRPANCLFSHRMLKVRGIFCMPDWRVAAEDYLAEELIRARSASSDS